MSSSDKTAEYAITADPTGFQAGMDKAVQAAKEAQNQIAASMGGLGDAFKLVQGHLAAFTALLTGGAAFKSSIDATKTWGGEVLGLSKQLGITTAEATAMNVALKHLGIDQAVVTGAVDKMNKTLVGNAAAYEALGIKTKDTNGAWRTGGEILPEVADKLRSITNETQRNIAGQAIFGKGWAEARAILKLTADEMENARKRAKELHLEVDTGQIRKYKESMNDLKLITTSLQVQLGNALMPTFTTLGQMMGQEGPAMAGVFSTALKSIGFIAGAVWLTLKDMGDSIGALAAQAAAIASGDFAMAKRIGDMRDEQYAKNEAQYEKFKTDMFNPAAIKSSGGNEGGGDSALDLKDKGGKDAKDQSRMAAWEEKLAIDKDGFEKQQQLAGTMQDFGKARERDYWKNILDTTSMSAVEKIQANRKYLALEHDLRKDAFDSEVAGEKAKLEDFHSNFNERIVIATRIYADLKARYGADSVEAKTALGDINKEQRKLAEQTLATNKVITESTRNKALAEIEFAQQDAELQVNLRQMTTGQLLVLEEGFEAKRYQIKMQALQEEEARLQASSDRNPTALATLHAQLEELERQHQTKIIQIKSQATVEANKDMTAMNAGIRSSLESSMASMMQGTMTLKKGLQAVWGAILQGFTQMIAKKVTAWAMGETAQTGATIAGDATRTTSSWMAATQSVMANAWAAVKNIAMKAWEVAASVYAALASIPVIGPFLAPIAAIAATGVVLGFAANIASAEGGYDIPAGISPMTQLHEKEMVLPAKHADVIRSLADGSSGGSGGGGGGGGDIHIHNNIQALDGASVQRVLLQNGHHIVTALRQQHRNFNFHA